MGVLPGFELCRVYMRQFVPEREVDVGSFVAATGKPKAARRPGMTLARRRLEKEQAEKHALYAPPDPLAAKNLSAADALATRKRNHTMYRAGWQPERGTDYVARPAPLSADALAARAAIEDIVDDDEYAEKVAGVTDYADIGPLFDDRRLWAPPARGPWGRYDSLAPAAPGPAVGVGVGIDTLRGAMEWVLGWDRLRQPGGLQAGAVSGTAADYALSSPFGLALVVGSNPRAH